MSARLLTPRELEIVTWLALGYDASRVSKVLRVAPSTTKEHIARAMGKTRSRTRNQLIASCIYEGVVPVNPSRRVPVLWWAITGGPRWEFQEAFRQAAQGVAWDEAMRPLGLNEWTLRYWLRMLRQHIDMPEERLDVAAALTAVQAWADHLSILSNFKLPLRNMAIGAVRGEQLHELFAVRENLIAFTLVKVAFPDCDDSKVLEVLGQVGLILLWRPTKRDRAMVLRNLGVDVG